MEKKLQNVIIDLLNINGVGFFWQNDSFGIKGRKRENRYRPNGVPDILGIVDGRFIAVEVKGPRGRLSDSQIKFKNAFQANGGVYILARSISDVRPLLTRDISWN